MDGRAPRRLTVRLNSGDIPVVYTLQVVNGCSLMAGWWIHGCRDDELDLDVVEKMIIEALIYADNQPNPSKSPKNTPNKR